MSDSEMIVNWLEAEGVATEFDNHLTATERAQAEAFRYLIEQGLYWNVRN